jgi:phosphatidylglycerol lysyltransferase
VTSVVWLAEARRVHSTSRHIVIVTVRVILPALLVWLSIALAPRSRLLTRVLRAGASVSAELVPRVLALTTFIGGAILLFSGATPARTGRMGWVIEVIPLPIIELSAYFVSIAGVALIVLARGIQRRLDAAYHLTIWVLAGGIVFALTSAFDVAQAGLLALMLSVFLPCHRYFYRKSSLFDERFTRGWFVAIGGVLTATAVLAYLGYGTRIITSQVFWEFGEKAHAPRAARALTFAVVALLAMSMARLMRPSRAREEPEHLEPGAIEAIVRASSFANAHLALLGDKKFVVNEAGTAFLMYGVAGSSRVVMGDPVGPLDEGVALIDAFIRRCKREGAWPAFYRVSPQLLYRYLDYGLSVVKLGEVARVPLPEFTLDGPKRRNLRRVWRKLAESGCSFELVSRDRVPELLPTLRVISESWLEQRKVREKGFSLGQFGDSFVSAGPLGIVRSDGRIIAFATLWVSGGHAEVEVDLMRYTGDAPPGVMRYLLVETMLWAKAQGFAYFNLGMAPLAGIHGGVDAPIWNQLAQALRAGGERYYNFQGLREFKAWFYPEWEPSYLASPGGVKRPLIVANIASLVSSGTGGVLRK